VSLPVASGLRQTWRTIAKYRGEADFRAADRAGILIEVWEMCCFFSTMYL